MEFTQSVKRNMTTGAYAQISGRASRSEYWWFVLFTLIASAAAGALDMLFPGDLLQTLFGIVTLLPGIALGIRRMQHTVVHEDTPQIRGMVFKVRHLVKVEEN